METAQSIDLNLFEKLRDPEYRKRYFLAEASAHIPEQLIALRKKRGLNQSELAEKIGTKQPAISRVERADYNNWSFSTLRSIADVLDARIKVEIQPSEEVLSEYEIPASQRVQQEGTTVVAAPSQLHSVTAALPFILNETGVSFDSWVSLSPLENFSAGSFIMRQVNQKDLPINVAAELKRKDALIDDKDREIARLSALLRAQEVSVSPGNIGIGAAKISPSSISSQQDQIGVL